MNQSLLTERSRCCCFTGHRPEKLNQPEEIVLAELRRAICLCISEGCTTFITGMAKGVDIWAAEIVLEERAKNPSLRLVCAVPHPKFGLRWRNGWTERFKAVLEAADEVHYISDTSSRSCYQLRNIWMVDHSCCVIAAYNGTKGGTRNTVEYAEKHGVLIYFLAIEGQDTKHR